MASSTEIEARLRAHLAPTHLEVADESAQHAGHAGARPGGGSHFRVTLVSAAFAGRSRVERQRLVYDALADDMRSGSIHALAMSTHTPEEWSRLQSDRGGAG